MLNRTWGFKSPSWHQRNCRRAVFALGGREVLDSVTKRSPRDAIIAGFEEIEEPCRLEVAGQESGALWAGCSFEAFSR